MSKFLKALILVIIFLIGVALIVLPFVYDMFDRTKAADEMMTAFDPVVNTDHATLLAQDLALLKGMAEDTEALLPKIAQQLQMTKEEINQWLGQEAPKLAEGISKNDGVSKMEEMLGRLGSDTKTITEQIDNFAAAKKLPVKATPWLMIGLGAVIVILLLLRLAMWKPAKKSKEAEPAKPAAPDPPTT